MVIEIGDCQLLARDGRKRPVDDSAAPIRAAAGKVVGVVVVFRDVGARKQVEEKLHHTATHDPLTGLPNRALLLDRLTRVLEYSKRHPEHGFAVLLLDQYQPIVSLADARVWGLEALLRWRHPERGLLLPGDFLELAQEAGFLNEIGESLLRTACRQALAWNGLRGTVRPISVSVNMSRRQFEQPGVVQQVARVLADTRLDPRSLCLDVTEAVLADPEVVDRTLRRLHELGVRLHVDDFGTGSSSLSALGRAPIDTLKIDGALVRRLDGGADDARIVRVVARLARELGVDVIAEGVETEGQAACLRGLGCGYGQGHWFSRPLDADAVVAVIGARGAV